MPFHAMTVYAAITAKTSRIFELFTHRLLRMRYLFVPELDTAYK